MTGHQLFTSEPIGNLFCLLAAIFEIPKSCFIIKPPACSGANVSIGINELLLLFSIISPCTEVHFYYVIFWKLVIIMPLILQKIFCFYGHDNTLCLNKSFKLLSTSTECFYSLVLYLFIYLFFHANLRQLHVFQNLVIIIVATCI